MAKYLDQTGLGALVERMKAKFSPVGHSHAAMRGATATAAGAAGFVPAPAAGDASRVLRADGTWGAGASGGDGGSRIFWLQTGKLVGGGNNDGVEFSYKLSREDILPSGSGVKVGDYIGSTEFYGLLYVYRVAADSVIATTWVPSSKGSSGSFSIFKTPAATKDGLGMVEVGSGLSITSEGVLSAQYSSIVVPSSGEIRVAGLTLGSFRFALVAHQGFSLDGPALLMLTGSIKTTEDASSENPIAEIDLSDIMAYLRNNKDLYAGHIIDPVLTLSNGSTTRLDISKALDGGDSVVSLNNPLNRSSDTVAVSAYITHY